ncbi:hypothetical protein HK100_003288 [Physocladia obscura]|uniref:mannan endo-1,4-beta-mannosidase n=1 Tax=Physocladia obscura TaxID=109957 RepID=A0AAD5TCS3_9FUNG|nr:hypothetical protein HK100_003288 [Physocladia obscura]
MTNLNSESTTQTNENRKQAQTTQSQTRKFFGFNTPNLHLIEDQTPWLIPTVFEQTDALSSLAQIGSTVTRIYPVAIQGLQASLFHVATVDYASANCNYSWSAIKNTSAPVLYANDNLFAALDSAIAVAASTGVQIIVPLIDQWAWWGGIPAFCAMHSTTNTSDFYWSPNIISNFLALSSYIVSRQNSITGKTYASDPAIYAWETGNELHVTNDDGDINPPPATWTLQVVAAIKAAGATQRVIDGSYSLYGWDPNVFGAVDGFTGHYYEIGSLLAEAYSFIVVGACFAAIFVVAFCICVMMLWRPKALGIHMKDPTQSLWKFMFGSRKFMFGNICFGARKTASTVAIHETAIELELMQTTSLSNESYSKEVEFGQRKTTIKRIFFSTVITAILSLVAAIALMSIGATLLNNYPTYAERFQKDVEFIARATNSSKSTALEKSKFFYVGEYGLSSQTQYSELLKAVTNTNNNNGVNVAGALIWSLRFHSRFGGFWNHHEDTVYSSYHLPGFNVDAAAGIGFSADEVSTIELIKNFSGNASISVGVGTRLFGSPPIQAPNLFVESVSVDGSSSGTVNLVWMGSAGAQSYTIQRGIGNLTAGAGSSLDQFGDIADEVSDAVASGNLVYQDSVIEGNIYSYRICGVASSGATGSYSNIVAVKV